jgi:hypothetical protein
MFIRKKMLTAPAESILGGVVPASPRRRLDFACPTLPQLRHVPSVFGHE